MLAVEILVQAVVVSRAVRQQKRRRPGLPGAMASIEKCRMDLGIAHVDAHRFVPAVRDAGEPCVESAAQRRDDLRERIGKILVLAAAEAVRSEERRVGKECRSRWSRYH